MQIDSLPKSGTICKVGEHLFGVSVTDMPSANPDVFHQNLQDHLKLSQQY